MSCYHFEELLSAYVDGELPAQDRESLLEHLKECKACRRTLKELKLVKAAFGSLSEIEVPEGLHERVMAALNESGAPKPGPAQARKKGFWAFLSRMDNWRFKQWASLLVGAAVIVMVISVGGTLFVTGQKGWLSRAASPRTESELGHDAPGNLFATPQTQYFEESGQDGLNRGQDGAAGIAQFKAAAPRRMIISRAILHVETGRGKVKEAADRATGIVQVHLGYVEQSSMAETVGTNDFTSFFMVARVPSESLDGVMKDLSDLGRVMKQDTSAQDVTDEYVDLDARLRNKIVQEDRLLKIIGEAQSVGDLLQVEGELSRVRGDIESMQAQIMNYDKSVALASLSFTATEEGASTKPPSPWNDLWRVFVNAWRNILFVAASSAPGIITLGFLAAGIFQLIRLVRRGKQA